MDGRARRALANAHSPQWWRHTGLPYLRKRAVQTTSQVLYSPPRPPSSLVAEDWDTLLVLDGCRYDLFAEANTLPGRLEYRISVGSATAEFLESAIEGHRFHDTVYVTANPMYALRGLDDVFYDVVAVWRHAWDDRRKTVLPGAVADATLAAARRHPTKRILAHFMQPHYPFVGPTAAELGDQSGFELSYRKATTGQAERDGSTVWELLEAGAVARDTVWRAYRENLEVTFPHVERLRRDLAGKTVVTSDHGNMLGERPFPLGPRLYGHPGRIHCAELRRVPWLVFDWEERAEVVGGDPAGDGPRGSEPAQSGANRSAAAAERLTDLGYVDP